MHKKFDHQEIEKKWQKRWRDQKLYEVSNDYGGKEKRYILTEYPYPSGNLHIGHWYAFAVPDIFVRAKRMQGKHVLYPIGFDSFGLPAENAAIKNKLDPKKWTYDNIDRMVLQLESMGNSYDWSRKVATSDPDYYRWTQWIFLQLFKKDLAYRGVGMVNWCPSCHTVLANEQVVAGECERCGSKVEQREMPQWLLRITDYADRLIDDLDKLDWPEPIKDSQRNWIGRSEGAEIGFAVEFEKKDAKPGLIPVFTTRPDTLFGATYLVLSPEHLWVTLATDEKHDVLTNKAEVKAYVEAAGKKSEIERQGDKEKTGVKLEGVWAVNSATKEKIPMYVADYVLAGYGTGAIMGVPAHDERDFAFAKKYNLPVRQVIQKIDPEIRSYVMGVDDIAPFEKIGVVVHEKTTDGNYKMVIPPGREKEFEQLIENHMKPGFWNEYIGLETVFIFKEKDGSLERMALAPETDARINERAGKFVHEIDTRPVGLWLAENSWYTDIMIHTEKGTLVNSGAFSGLTSEEAKIKITEKVGGKMTRTYRLRDWSISRQRYWGCPIPIVYDPEGKPHAVPDEHLPWLLPEDVDFTPTGVAPLTKSEALKKRVVDIFGEGWTPEVETMDAFVDSSWYFLRYTDPKNTELFASKEAQIAWTPVDLYFGGAEHTTMHLLYSRFMQKALYDLDLTTVPEPYTMRINRGLVLGPDGNKMSKSKGNVIDPDEQVARLGADTVKMYLAFMGPYGEVANYPWDMGGIAGIRRFLERVYGLKDHTGDGESPEVTKLLHHTIDKVTRDINNFKFNTATSALMIFLNAAEKEGLSEKSYKTFLQLLAPFAPHLADELWEAEGEQSSIHLTKWPIADQRLLVKEMATIAVQIDGKVRATIMVAVDTDEQSVTDIALKEDRVAKRLKGAEIHRVVYVPGKVLNFITVQPVP